MGNLKKKKEIGDYYLGFDIGTNSVGFAVTDLDYNIMKFNKKHIWGIRLFEEAKTAKERRTFRSIARRLERRRKRIKMLEEIFSKEISKIDMSFYERLEDSKYYKEDKTDKTNRFTLFNDKNFNDIDYHKAYPTIYHLRYDLLTNKEKEFDVRLLFLAIHHMMKKRGHFLFEGEEISNIKLDTSYIALKNYLKENSFEDFLPDETDDNINKFESILLNKNISSTERKKELIIFCDKFYKKNKMNDEILKAILGLKFSIEKIFLIEDIQEGNLKELSFRTSDIDDKISKIANEQGDEKAELLNILKQIYDYSVFSVMLNKKDYLSEAKIDVYNEHKEDLKELKELIRKNLSKIEYKDIFSNDSNNKNYSSYINGKMNQEDFNKLLKKYFDKNEILKENKLYKKIESNKLLPKQTDISNGSIPYQINLRELKEMLKNAKRYMNFLNKKDENGISVEEKIILIFKFKIPYYIGPLNDAHKGKGGNAWIIKNKGMENISIRPWNFKDIVNIEESAERFIDRMTNMCTYLKTEKVVPKDSIYFKKYLVLNELNNLTINGNKMSVEMKQDIFNNVYTYKKKVTIKILKKYLKANWGLKDTDLIAGYDIDLVHNMSSYIDFNNIFDSKLETEEEKDMVENIIKYIVVFSDEKKMLKKRINRDYPNLDKKTIEKIISLKYTGFSRFSKEFLVNTYGADTNTGETFNILDGLYNTQDNLMQLLSNKYTFLEEIVIK